MASLPATDPLLPHDQAPRSHLPEEPISRRFVAVASHNWPKTLFGLFSDSVVESLGTLWLPGAGHPFGLFWGSGPEGPGRPLCLAGGFPTLARGLAGWSCHSKNYCCRGRVTACVCSHSSRCLDALGCDSAFCAPKVQSRWYG